MQWEGHRPRAMLPVAFGTYAGRYIESCSWSALLSACFLSDLGLVYLFGVGLFCLSQVPGKLLGVPPFPSCVSILPHVPSIFSFALFFSFLLSCTHHTHLFHLSPFQCIWFCWRVHVALVVSGVMAWPCIAYCPYRVVVCDHRPCISGIRCVFSLYPSTSSTPHLVSVMILHVYIYKTLVTQIWQILQQFIVML